MWEKSGMKKGINLVNKLCGQGKIYFPTET